MRNLTTRIATLKTPMLLETVHSLKDDLTDDAMMVSDAVLVELEKRSPEGEFVALCELV